MIDVTCAVIRNEDDEVLIVQRGEGTDHPFKWEFPGGKVNRGETDEECIIREIREELSMNIVIFRRLSNVEYDYGHKQIRLIPFICDTLDDLPFLSEHVAYKWISPEKLRSVDFSEADVFVSEEYVKNISMNSKSNEIAPAEPGTEIVNDAELQAMINRMISMKEAEWVALSAAENPAIFRKLLEYSYSDDTKLAFHSSWTLSKACDKYPEMIEPFLGQIVESIGKIENESTIRSFLRILSLSDLPKLSGRQQGMLADYSFQALNSPASAIAIKAYSMEILYRLSVIYPDLIPELAASINRVFEYKSAGITSRGKHILKKLGIKE
jgi:8-oxo-dGTP diphosphatase